ncbi:hypothetical protein [Sphingomonas sp.]|uniref:hypothetical protein n=1 Tax=Sphingomonas sp. TaxID=28214 RepID=UPI003AFF736D
MPQIGLDVLIDRLDPIATDTLGEAMQLCVARGSPFVELPHWVACILLRADSDWHRVLARYPAVDVARLSTDLTAAMDRAAPADDVGPGPVRPRSPRRCSGPGCTRRCCWTRPACGRATCWSPY